MPLRILHEPLVHFLVIGAAVFGLYAAIDGPETVPRERIVVSEGRVQQLAQVFARTWQRPPTQEELRGLVEGYVKEEVYYREAVKLGLDRDDTAIRRRLQQKMEFLIEPPADELQPGDGELEAFLAANRARFRVEPQFAFHQVFISAEKPEPAALRAASTLKDLRAAGAGSDAERFGDPTLLPSEMPLAPLRLIARSFGESFAETLATLPGDEWQGPVPSPYGLHLVRVTQMSEGYDPPLKEVRAEVLQEWQHQKRQAYAAQEYQRLREAYEIVLPADDAARAAGAPAQ